MLYYAVELNELIRDFKKKVVIEGTSIMVTWLADQAYAIQDRCTHLGASLSKGTIDEKAVTCRSHGAKFNLESGDVLVKPHIGPIKMPAKKAKTFPTVVKEGKVYIDF